MRVAMFVETGGDLQIEDVEPAAPGARDVVVRTGRERRLPLRPFDQERLRAA